MFTILSATIGATTRSLEGQFTRLQYLVEEGNRAEVTQILTNLDTFATSSDPEHLGILLHAESLLAGSAQSRDLRQDILLAVMVQSRRLGHEDLQMSAYFQFAQLLTEQGEYQRADEFVAVAQELQQAIFGTTTFLTPVLARSVRSSPSSASDEGAVRIDFSALGSWTWLGILTKADAAMKRGFAFRDREEWEEARGEFLTAYLLLERDGESVSDGALVRAQAAYRVAETYLKRFLYEEAIPYAEHAVRLYQNQPRHRAPHAFREALFVLHEAYSVGLYYEERREVQRLIDEFPDVG